MAVGREDDEKVAARDLKKRPGDGSHGEEAVDAGGPGGVRGA